MDRNLGEHFAIECDIGLGQTFNESAIADVVHSACRGNAGDPKSAVVPFFLATMCRAVGHGVQDGLVGLTKQIAACSSKAFRLL